LEIALRESYAIRVYKEYFNFAAAHFLIFADGSREELHGHNYQAQVKLEGELVEGELVVDFIPFKPMFKKLCDDLDHRTLLPRDNPHLEIIEEESRVQARHRDGSVFQFPKQDVLILPLPNTSTEMLARHLAHRLFDLLPTELPSSSVHAIEIQVEESRGQSGICRLENEVFPP
jgi:6-pyruvoyltetrahydropterin/6-carboxytetrahydropterin synthase